MKKLLKIIISLLLTTLFSLILKSFNIDNFLIGWFSCVFFIILLEIFNILDLKWGKDGYIK